MKIEEYSNNNNDIGNLGNKTKQFVKNNIEIKLRYEMDIKNALDEATTIVITDKEGIINYVNQKFCEISKFSEKELLGKTPRILKSGHHSQEFYSNLWKTISNGKIWTGDIQNKAKDGTFYWLKTTIIPVFDENQNIRNYISIRTDITPQIELSKKLVKAERLASIGQLASRMSHDIRNPLSVIQVSLENLKILYGAGATQLIQIEKIERSIGRITHQIDDVLDFVREQPLELKMTKLSEIIVESMDSLIVPNNVQLILPKNDIGLLCDKKQFSIVLNNLILNGIQAINGAGTIEIIVEENHDVTVIRIQDSGIGISKENLDKIFEPLFTTKQKGTGLGLASVKSIIASHEGMISVTSPPTIFTIRLPKP